MLVGIGLLLLDDYEAAVDQEQLAGTTLSLQRTSMENFNRTVDRLIKEE